MGTASTETGTYVYRVKDYLNGVVGNQHNYVYEYIGTTTSKDYVYNKIKNNVNDYLKLVMKMMEN